MHINKVPGHSGAGSLIRKTKFTEKVHIINHMDLDLCIKVKIGIPIIIKIDTEGTERAIINQLVKTKFLKALLKFFMKQMKKITH